MKKEQNKPKPTKPEKQHGLVGVEPLVIRLSKDEKLLFNILGWLGILFILPFAYSNFFERESYLTRKKLLDYIEKNGLGKKHDRILGHSWNINGYDLIYWNSGEVSLYIDMKCVLSSFHKGVWDTRNYNKIRSILAKAV